MSDKNLDDAAREAWNVIDEGLQQRLRAIGIRPSHELEPPPSTESLIAAVREVTARMAEAEADMWHQRFARAIGRVPLEEADRMKDRAEMFRAFAAKVRAPR